MNCKCQEKTDFYDKGNEEIEKILRNKDRTKIVRCRDKIEQVIDLIDVLIDFVGETERFDSDIKVKNVLNFTVIEKLKEIERDLAS